MLRRRLCEATFEWRLQCPGPLLIADGRYEKRKDEKKKGKRPDKVFISRNSASDVEKAVEQRDAAALGLVFYVPGTSLRGPFRAHAERIVRSLRPPEERPPGTACDPFEEKAGGLQSCSQRLVKTAFDPAYAAVCPTCKLFGCTGSASRIQFTDADLGRTGRSVYRDMIGIDRFTGGVFTGELDETGDQKTGGANMRFHALEDTTFTTVVTVQNFELWQLGLLAYVFRDFADGLVAIGFGKSKGFGQVRGEVRKITLTYPVGYGSARIDHLGTLCSSEERANYGIHEQAAPALDLRHLATDGFDLYQRFEVADLGAFSRATAPAFGDFIRQAAAGAGGTA